MPTKISMRTPATMAYVLKPKTMPIAIDSTRNSSAALDILLLPLLLPALSIILSCFELKVMDLSADVTSRLHMDWSPVGATKVL